MQLSECFKLYVSNRRMYGYSEKTLEGYDLQMRLLTRHIGDMEISEVKYEHLREYMLHCSGWLETSSLSHRMKFVRAFFQWATNEGIILTNPAVRIMSPRIGNTVPKFLTEEEIEEMRSKCVNPRDRALLEILYSTGVRISELHNMNIRDINMYEKMILVRGKGNKERVVFFDDTCKFWLDRYLETRGDSNEALFTTIRGQTRRCSTYQIRHTIKNIASRTNIRESVYPHRFRHSLATHLVEKGADLGTVQKILGHADAKSTQIYAHASTSRLRQQYNLYR